MKLFAIFLAISVTSCGGSAIVEIQPDLGPQKIDSTKHSDSSKLQVNFIPFLPPPQLPDSGPVSECLTAAGNTKDLCSSE